MNQPTQTGGKLDGQLAIITGASSGIGRAIAQAFLDAGADLIVVALARTACVNSKRALVG